MALVLGRRAGEAVYIDVPGGPTLKIVVADIRPGAVRLGFEAPRDYTIRRDDAGPKKQP